MTQYYYSFLPLGAIVLLPTDSGSEFCSQNPLYCFQPVFLKCSPHVIVTNLKEWIWGKLHEKCMKYPKQFLVTVPWEEHKYSFCIHAVQIKCTEMFYYLFLNNAERGEKCTYAFFLHIHVTWKVWRNHHQYLKLHVCGSLSPRHGASSGCGWRNGLRYGG